MEKGQSEEYTKHRWSASNSARLSSPSPVGSSFISSSLLGHPCRPASFNLTCREKYLQNSWKTPWTQLCLFFLSAPAPGGKGGSCAAKLPSVIYFPWRTRLCACVFVFLGGEQESAAAVASKTLLTSPAASAAAAGISSRSSSSSFPCPGQING